MTAVAWLTAAMSLTGVVLNVRRLRACFLLWLVANVLWCLIDAAAAAGQHISASLPAISGDYMGEHWLATYALLALTAGWRAEIR